MTYEFPNTDSLKSWLNSREELDGYELSADGEAFFSVDAFPQIEVKRFARSVAPASQEFEQTIERSALAPVVKDPMKTVPPSLHPPVQPPSSGSPATGSFGEYDAPVPTFDGPAAAASNSGHATAPVPKKSSASSVLWAICFLLFVVALAMAIQLTGVFDLVGTTRSLILGQVPVVESSTSMISLANPIERGR